MLGGYFQNQPALTVSKDGQVIETIYLDDKDIFLMGRSSDSDIVVGHASTSRQHLEIQVIRATQELILTDLASGHGTCVNGKRIPGLTPTVAKEGDVIQLAASTRTYVVQWIHPLSIDESCKPFALLEGQPTPPKRSNSSPAFKQGDSKFAPPKKEQDKRTLARSSSRWDNDETGSPRRLPKAQQKGRAQTRSANEENEVPYSPQRTPQKDSLDLPPRAAPRRLAFSSLQASSVNVRSPRSPSSKKTSVDKTGSTHRNVKQHLKIQTRQEAGQTGISQGTTRTNLWLRRCNSAPPPALKTSGYTDVEKHDVSDANVSTRETSVEDADATLLRISEQLELETQDMPAFESSDEGYDSNIENIPPQDVCVKSSEEGRSRSLCPSLGPNESSAGAERIPFQPLPIEASQDSPQELYTASTLGLPRLRLQSSAAVKNLDQLFRRLALTNVEEKRQWHMVVDTSCLLQPDSLKVFRQLEGNKDIRVIIPKIVIRELDSLRHRANLGHLARAALNWIDSCMRGLPSWIHVQNSSETVPTPTADAFSARSRDDLMSPTNDDHILECALLFDKKIREGKVALLTRDTALKIKAMAEGLISENEVEFCESLLSPYSERFLWAGSMAHKQGMISPNSIPSPVPRLGNSKKLLSPISGLRQHYNDQPKGLRLVLA